jgi:hypothetical protein
MNMCLITLRHCPVVAFEKSEVIPGQTLRLPKLGGTDLGVLFLCLRCTYSESILNFFENNVAT